jgi:motility quorum-sensing regulator / GCU-specific mRNA interferase toxin
MSERRPTYRLTELQALVRQGRFVVTTAAADTASRIGFSRVDIVQTVLQLRRADFYKTMPSEKVPGLWQDVYRPRVSGMELYVKLQVTPSAVAVVISFKER